MAVRRIQKELQELLRLNDLRLTVRTVDDDSIFEWTVVLQGPPQSPYEGGSFHLSVKLPTDYPFKPPKMRFVTKVYHPNINEQGAFSLDNYKGDWTPAWTIHKLLVFLLSLLTEPNPYDPLEPRVAQHYLQDKGAFDATAREWTALHAASSSIRR